MIHAHIVILVDPVFDIVDRVQDQDEQQQPAQSDTSDESHCVTRHVRSARPQGGILNVVTRYLLEELLWLAYPTKVVG